MNTKRGRPQDDKSGTEPEEADRLKQLVDRKAVLAWLGTLSMVGWSIALPIVLGILAGRELDARLGSAPVFLIVLLLAGIVLGCGIAWRWIKKAIER